MLSYRCNITAGELRWNDAPDDDEDDSTAHGLDMPSMSIPITVSVSWGEQEHAPPLADGKGIDAHRHACKAESAAKQGRGTSSR